ncbi:hypothetical protein [Arthrobacter sp. LFS091]|uniref:hypothetical protein n=1 Tax=Arthrobacter sp. LFS091 TaxID=3229892 RepID=UPI003A813488
MLSFAGQGSPTPPTSPYDTPGDNIAIPISSTEYAQVNAEFIDRSSTIAPTTRVTLPAATHKPEDAAAVEHHMETIQFRPPAAANCTLTSPEHAAPIPTIGYINWWEGRGSKAHPYLQLALDTDPGYRFAPHRPHARRRHHRKLEHQQKHRLPERLGHAIRIRAQPDGLKAVLSQPHHSRSTGRPQQQVR